MIEIKFREWFTCRDIFSFQRLKVTDFLILNKLISKMIIEFKTENRLDYN
jgi:hypothetical protein